MQFLLLSLVAHYATLHRMTLDEYFAGTDAKTPVVLADEIGVSESTLSRIRRGKQNTTRDVIQKIIVATGHRVSAEALVGIHAPFGTHDDCAVSPNNCESDIRSGDRVTKQADDIAANSSLHVIPNNPLDNIREGAHSDGPFLDSPSTCSTTPELKSSCVSPACSTGEAEAA